ncbi:MAG: cell wall-binding repeat-containing protein, partial [Herbiconiux sp.]|nr:cell wall-binding repeat-containing protein [Herbiconiux sp.]
MRTVARAAAAALMVGLIVSGGALSSPATASAVTAAPTADIPLPPVPYNRVLTAGYGTDAAGATLSLPAAATSVDVTLPAEAAPLGLTEAYLVIYGTTQRVFAELDLDLDPAGGLGATATIEPGALAALEPLLGDAGEPFLRFAVTGDVTYPARFGPPIAFGSGPLSNTGTLDLDGVITLDSADQASTAALSLDRDSATSFALTTSFWSTPEPAVWVRPGGTVTLSGIPATASGVAAARLDARTAGPSSESSRIDLDAHPSADGSVLEVGVPGKVDLSEYLSAAGALRLSVSVTADDEEVIVRSDVSAAQATSIAGVETTRISGETRFAGAYAVAREGFPRAAETIYFPTGDTFPDALSVAPAAARSGAPVLLGMTQYEAGNPRYQPVVGYVESFRPHYVKVVGGFASVSDGWPLEFSMSGIQSTRIDGVDRYAVSRRIAMEEFGYDAPTVFITTGVTFPDALSAVPAAVSQKAPIILVNGTASHLDAETADALRTLRTSEVVIVGGPASVSTGIKADLSALLGADRVQRIGGDDRYAVAKAVNRQYFAEAPEVYLATGLNFPDALTGGVLAASNGAPLLLARTDCVPGSALDAMNAWGTTRVILLGGPNSLSTAVLDLQRCP